jgi:NAD(P)-dependent dehydrogenase (short-subunit alcohol dehydrogenase family)
MERLRAKALLITGATGIAAATARAAVREGARVFIASLHESECRTLGEELDARWTAGDLSEAACADAAVSAAFETLGRLDGVFNVAGASGRRYGDGPVHECSDEGWDRTLRINLRSMFLVCRASLARMIPAGAGTILNMASVSALSPEPRHFAAHAYAAAKGGAIALTTSMAAYYAPMGIRVNAVAPGSVRTPMSQRAQGDAAINEFLRAKQPLPGGFLEPEDIAGLAVFLLSDEARGITGQTYIVDGGWSLA